MGKITIQLLIVLVLGVLLVGCGQGKIPKNESTSIEKVEKEANTADNQLSEIEEVNYDTIEFRFLPKEEQYKRAEPFHVYGDLKLRMLSPLFYEFKDREKGIKVKERFPGVLSYSYWIPIKDSGEIERKPYSGFKLEFYNKKKELTSMVNLEKETPYTTKRFPNVNQGYLDMEYFEDGDQFDPNYLESANYFSTVNEIITRSNGFTIIEYQLIPVNGRKIIGREETLVAYDPFGNKLNEITLPLSIRSPWVSDDGQFLAFTAFVPYSGQKQFFRIYDLKSLELIYEQKVLSEQEFVGLGQIENGFLMLGNLYKNGNERMLYFFDFNNRIKYSKHLSGEERKKAFKRFTSYSRLLKEIPFNQEKF